MLLLASLKLVNESKSNTSVKLENLCQNLQQYALDQISINKLEIMLSRFEKTPITVRMTKITMLLSALTYDKNFLIEQNYAKVQQIVQTIISGLAQMPLETVPLLTLNNILREVSLDYHPSQVRIRKLDL